MCEGHLRELEKYACIRWPFWMGVDSEWWAVAPFPISFTLVEIERDIRGDELIAGIVAILFIVDKTQQQPRKGVPLFDFRTCAPANTICECYHILGLVVKNTLSNVSRASTEKKKQQRDVGHHIVRYSASGGEMRSTPRGDIVCPVKCRMAPHPWPVLKRYAYSRRQASRWHT